MIWIGCCTGSITGIGPSETLHPLQDMRRGERAFRGDIGRLRISHRLAGDRAAHLQRRLEVVLHDAPGAAVTGAALDHPDRRRRAEAQHFGRLLPHVLGAGVAGDVQRDAAVERLKARRQPLALRAMSTTYSAASNIARLKRLDVVIVRHEQRPLELQHQRAGRDQRDDVVALVDPRPQCRRRRVLAPLRDPGEIAVLELRHAAAADG